MLMVPLVPTFPALPALPRLETLSVPLLIEVAPEYVFAPPSTSVPAPFLASVPPVVRSWMTPLNVTTLAAPLAAIDVAALEPREIVRLALIVRSVPLMLPKRPPSIVMLPPAAPMLPSLVARTSPPFTVSPPENVLAALVSASTPVAPATAFTVKPVPALP